MKTLWYILRDTSSPPGLDSADNQGIPRRVANPPPTIPRRGAPPEKSRIKGIKQIVVVASGKGGVGKSTVAGAFLALTSVPPLLWRAELNGLGFRSEQQTSLWPCCKRTS